MNWYSICNQASSMTEALALYKEARAPRDYKREYAQYHSKPKRIAERAQRNQARRIVGLAKGDPREVDHKNPISNGGSNAKSNLRAVSLVENRKKFTKTAGLLQQSAADRKRLQPLIDAESKRLSELGLNPLLSGSVARRVNLPGESDLDFAVGTDNIDETSSLLERSGIPFAELIGKNRLHQYTTNSGVPIDVQVRPTKEVDFLRAGTENMAKLPESEIEKILIEKDRLKRSGDKDAYNKYKYDVYERHGVFPKGGDWSKLANDREKTYAEMRDAIRSFAAKQNIDPEKAMLVAGGAGYMHGMRDEVNDLDFFHDDLPDFVKAPHGRFEMDGGPGKDLPDAAKQYQIMHGMRVQTPEAMLAFYQRLNRPKDQEKIKMLQAHLKTASTKHHLITGVPGAGKSTIARSIAKEKGLPLFEIDSDPRFKHALQLIDEGKMDESNALQKQMFHDAIARKDPHVIEGAQVMLDPTLARQHELQILDGSVDELAPRWANREAIKHRERAVSAGKLPTKDETYYDSLYRNTVYPRYQEQLAGLRKTASSQHYLVTGHSGAGKSTLARKLSEETGAPVVSLDDVPSIRALLEEQKATAKASGGKLDLSPETTAKKKAIELKAIQDAIAANNPSIIEGSYLLDHDPSMFKGHKMMLVDRDRDSILNQRVERQRLKDIGRGREWSSERAAGVRSRGEQLLNHYQPGVDAWRGSSLVEKRAARLYHGSPYEGLTSLLPREPRGHTDYQRQQAVFMTDNPDAAALYALARDKERKNRGWSAIGGRLQLGPGASLNEKGYLYSVDTDDYQTPPVGQENSGFAIPREIGVSGVKEVTPAEYEHLIDRFDTKDAFKAHVDSLVEKRASAIATKTDPAKWEAAKQEAKSKMGGKHSARAMQLATKIYKDNGGGYSGAKPTSSTNSLKKWTKQDWGYSGKDKPGPGGTGVYLPKQRRIALKSSEEGKKLLAAATRRKAMATKKGQQYSSHGLAAGTSLVNAQVGAYKGVKTLKDY